MITELQIWKLVDEHVKDMDISYGSEITFAKLNFLAGLIAILKWQNNNDFRFMNSPPLIPPRGEDKNPSNRGVIPTKVGISN